MIQTEEHSAKSHSVHEQHWINHLPEKEMRIALVKQKDNVAYHMNTHSLRVLKPLLQTSNTWLTIGDYNGFEANYLAEHNQNVCASDISDAFLKEAKAEGLITEYKKINVEHIDLDENSYDYVSCREAFHHFPRAYLGLYEMLRVAKKGAIIIEPIDILLKMPWVLWLKNMCDLINPLLINKIWKNRFSWEVVGNYVFKISEREIEKMAMGIGLPCIAFKGINVLLHIKEDVTVVPTDQKLLRKLNRKISFLNFLCRLHLIPYNTLCAIIFKEQPEESLMQNLKTEGYTILPLPKNPYLK